MIDTGGCHSYNFKDESRQSRGQKYTQFYRVSRLAISMSVLFESTKSPVIAIMSNRSFSSFILI